MPILRRILHGTESYDFNWSMIYGLGYINPMSKSGVAAKDLENLLYARRILGFRVIS